jgi:hypothetical protein
MDKSPTRGDAALDVLRFLSLHAKTGTFLTPLIYGDPDIRAYLCEREVALATRASAPVLERLAERQQKLFDERGLCPVGTVALLALARCLTGPEQVQVIDVPADMVQCFAESDLPDAADFGPLYDEFLVTVPGGWFEAPDGSDIRVLYVKAEPPEWDAELGREARCISISACSASMVVPVAVLRDWEPATLLTTDLCSLEASARLVLHVCLYMLTSAPRERVERSEPSRWATGRARKTRAASKTAT